MQIHAVPNKKGAGRVFATVISLQLLAVAYILFFPKTESQEGFREVILFLLYFTGVPVIATLLVMVLQKIDPRSKK
jgi:hypothetical protein